MGANVRFQPRSQTVTVSMSRALDPAARSRRIAEIARVGLAEIERESRRAGAGAPSHQTIVDGRSNVPLESVDPDHGSILFRFGMLVDVVQWVHETLVKTSPVLSGDYSRSHALYADGREADLGSPPQASEYVFLNAQPYARKIERGESSQAPQGVYEGVAALADRRFANSASVSFDWRSPLSYQVAAPGSRARGRSRQLVETRVPAIVIRSR